MAHTHIKGGETSDSFSINSCIVGIDVHKYQHTAVALNCFGKRISTITFSSDKNEECISWLSNLGQKDNVIVGLEDTAGHGKSLATSLIKDGYRVHTVPPILTDRARAHSVHKDKNDLLDATRVGKVILHQSEETLPATPIVSEEQQPIANLDFMIQERNQLVTQQTALKNQLHMLLHQQYGNEYRREFKDIFTAKATKWYLEDMEKDTSALSLSIVRHIKRLILTQEQIAEIERSVKETSKALPQIKKLAKDLNGCGLLTAVATVVEIKTITRFATSSKLAKYAGIAPISRESAGHGRMRTNPFGNRKLNHSLHVIALSQIANRGNDQAKKYYEKKQKEGKTKLWSMRCLKRHISDKIYAILMEHEISKSV